MLPSKRPRMEMEEDSSSWENTMVKDLENMKGEVEPVEVKRSTSNKIETVTYRPTYKAILARKGLLVKETLGSGSYSKVKLAFSVENDFTKAAVKIIDRNKAPKDFQQRFLPRELSIWPRMVHPNIIRMREKFEDGFRVFIILEYADNGDVLRYIRRSGAIGEKLSRIWIRQLCDAVRYLHEQDITHRDLKLENLLLDTHYNIKLCDFGFVKDNSMRELSKTYCGSKSYASPEILRGDPYEPKKADIWAIGVILYIFVTGKMPYDESKGNHGVLDEQKNLNFPWHKFKHVTPEGKSLILWLFENNYKDRPDIHTVIGSEWIRNGLDEGDAKCSDPCSEALQNNERPEIQREFEAVLKRSKTK